MKTLSFSIFKTVCSLIVFSSLSVNTNALQIDPSKIDVLFSEFDVSTPGASVMVVKEGEAVYTKGYGSANLEYNTLITDNTQFHIASLSKQFTVFAILLLESEGKLSLNDEIHTYLPDLPDFGKKITLKNLANHSSGLRDQWDLLAMSGVRLDDVITQNHVMKLISLQKELNFSPGEKYLYCNTGFTLLAEVVKKVSGRSFADFTRERIFEPLGMEDTHFYDDHTKLVQNRAYSYTEEEGQFLKSTLSYATVGATGLSTTAEDFVAWALNFEKLTVGDQKMIKKMEKDRFGFALGQFVGKYNGVSNFFHSGSDAGYRSYFIRLPKERISVAVFSNLSTFNAAGTSLKIVDYLLTGELPSNLSSQPSKTVPEVSDLDAYIPADLQDYVGSYLSHELQTVYNLEIVKERLILKHARIDDTILSSVEKNAFTSDVYFLKNLEFERGKSGDVIGLRISNDRVKNLQFKKMEE